MLIIAREQPRSPTLDQVRDKVRSDWIEAQRLARRDAFQARLRARYRVTIDWPEPYASQPIPASVPRIERPAASMGEEE